MDADLPRHRCHLPCKRPDMDHCVCVCELRYLLHNFGPDRFLALAVGGSVPRINGDKGEGRCLGFISAPLIYQNQRNGFGILSRYV